MSSKETYLHPPKDFMQSLYKDWNKKLEESKVFKNINKYQPKKTQVDQEDIFKLPITAEPAIQNTYVPKDVPTNGTTAVQPIQSSTIIQNIGKTSVLSNKVTIEPATSKQLISFSGNHTILSLAIALKSPVLSLQNVEISINIDSAIYKDTLLNSFMVMKLGKGFMMKYYEEITNIGLTIADTLYNSGSIFYMYIIEPITIADNFSIFINNTSTVVSTPYALITSKIMYMVRGT